MLNVSTKNDGWQTQYTIQPILMQLQGLFLDPKLYHKM